LLCNESVAEVHGMWRLAQRSKQALVLLRIVVLPVLVLLGLATALLWADARQRCTIATRHSGGRVGGNFWLWQATSYSGVVRVWGQIWTTPRIGLDFKPARWSVQRRASQTEPRFGPMGFEFRRNIEAIDQGAGRNLTWYVT